MGTPPPPLYESNDFYFIFFYFIFFFFFGGGGVFASSFSYSPSQKAFVRASPTQEFNFLVKFWSQNLTLASHRNPTQHRCMVRV